MLSAIFFFPLLIHCCVTFTNLTFTKLSWKPMKHGDDLLLLQRGSLSPCCGGFGWLLLMRHFVQTWSLLQKISAILSSFDLFLYPDWSLIQFFSSSHLWNFSPHSCLRCALFCSLQFSYLHSFISLLCLKYHHHFESCLGEKKHLKVSFTFINVSHLMLRAAIKHGDILRKYHSAFSPTQVCDL